jgi:hypothetical protein
MALSDDHVNAIYFDSSKNAWIGTDSGHSQIVDERWFNYTMIDVNHSNSFGTPQIILKGLSPFI